MALISAAVRSHVLWPPRCTTDCMRILLSLGLIGLSVTAWSCGNEAFITEGTSSTDSVAEELGALTLSSARVTLPSGSHVDVTVTMGGGGTTAWKLSSSGLPSGVTASFAPASISGGKTSALRLSEATSATGSGTATIEAVTAAGTRRTATLHLTVTPSGQGNPPPPMGGGPGTGGAPGTGGGGAGHVGPTGGTVDLLRFALTGDTRPAACEDTAGYPTAIINAIADGAEAQQAQFALDLGDHMYVCNGSLATATDQMNLYMASTRRFSKHWFMTMGNHECFHGPCQPGSSNANYVAFMSALSPTSPLPYYSFEVETRLGKATFIVLADNAWDSTQAQWFESTLAHADTAAKYTIVARHHPEGDTSVATNQEAMVILRRHRFALFLSGHNHSYHHMTTDNGRDVVIGLGGAPLLANGTTYNGYAMVEQQADGQLRLTVRSITGGTVQDTFLVGPNP